MKRRIAILTVTVMMISAFAGCSQSADTASKEDNAEGQAAESQLVNDNPIQANVNEIKPAVEYFNEHAYTSDFTLNEHQPNLNSYWVYKEDNERRKVTLDNKMTVDDTLTIVAGDDLTEILKTDYLTNYESNDLDRTLNSNDTSMLYGTTADHNDIFTVDVKNFSENEQSVKDCTIYRFGTGYYGESCEYMGLHKGDSLDKVIDTIGSPNQYLDFDKRGAFEYRIVMRYVDAVNERTVQVNIKLTIDGDDKEAIVDGIFLFDVIEDNIAH
ncbi:MAG: hypothetical protein K2M73_01995 [Lachnospiraceae bacterium]|nr:hypothetical protein [Lachnospiraceae bacterium]